MLASICIFGVLIFLFLRPTPWAQKDLETFNSSPIVALKSAFRLSLTRDMLLLSIAFFYTGMVGTFLYGVYGSAIGFTSEFGSRAKSLVGLHGIVLGIGETLSGLFFTTLGRRLLKDRSDVGIGSVVVIVGFLFHLIAFILIFINLPPDSPYQVIVN